MQNIFQNKMKIQYQFFLQICFLKGDLTWKSRQAYE